MLTKNPLNYYSLKVTKFHDDSVKNKSARTKKTTACLELKNNCNLEKFKLSDGKPGKRIIWLSSPGP